MAAKRTGTSGRIARLNSHGEMPNGARNVRSLMGGGREPGRLAGGKVKSSLGGSEKYT